VVLGSGADPASSDAVAEFVVDAVAAVVVAVVAVVDAVAVVVVAVAAVADEFAADVDAEGPGVQSHVGPVQARVHDADLPFYVVRTLPRTEVFGVLPGPAPLPPS